MKVVPGVAVRPLLSLRGWILLVLALPGGGVAQAVPIARALELGDEGVALADSRSDATAGVACLNESAWAPIQPGRHETAMRRARDSGARARGAGLLEGRASEQSNAEFQTDRAQREIERLRAEADLAAATAERRGTQLVAAILLALVLILLYGRHVAKRVQHELEHKVEARTAELSEMNQRLQALSLTDSLTGLRNRRYLFQSIESELATSLRAYRDAVGTGAPPESADIVFYLLDVDDFKSVNDEHGHAAGDRVLEQVARVLEDTGRASDVVVRWGGEEFLILSRHVDRAGAAVFAQRVRDAIRDHVFVADEGVTLRRTCSVGFAAFPFVLRDPRAVSWDQVVGLADQAAYVAKRSGRDAWVGVYANDTTPPEAIRGDAATLETLVRRGVLEVVTSMDAETRRRVLGEPVRGSRRNA